MQRVTKLGVSVVVRGEDVLPYLGGLLLIYDLKSPAARFCREPIYQYINGQAVSRNRATKRRNLNLRIFVSHGGG